MIIERLENKNAFNKLGRELLRSGAILDNVYQTSSGLFVIVSNDPSPDGPIRHLSASHQDRLPSYYEMKQLRYTLCADVDYMAMIFPPPDEFVNVHPNCLHLHEIRGKEKIMKSLLC